MAKIIVTRFLGPYQKPVKTIIDSDICKFQEVHGDGTNVKFEHGGFTVVESIEEIQKRINDAEFESTNPKLDLILETLERIEKRLDELGSREVISVEEF